MRKKWPRDSGRLCVCVFSVYISDPNISIKCKQKPILGIRSVAIFKEKNAFFLVPDSTDENAYTLF